MTGILLPSKLKKFSSGAEITKMEEERQAKQKKQQQQNELRDAFMAREIHPEAVTRINKAIRIAAEQGHHQLEVAASSCKFYSDGGRRINIADPEWPSTLEGFAKKAHEFFVKELRCWLQASRRDHQLPGWHARRSRALPEVVNGNASDKRHD